jgi:hypothetical protein
MADRKPVRLIHANGSAVTVDPGKVEALLARGFTQPEPPKPARSRKK